MNSNENSKQNIDLCVNFLTYDWNTYMIYQVIIYINLLFNFYYVTPFPCRAIHQTLKKSENKSIQAIIKQTNKSNFSK